MRRLFLVGLNFSDKIRDVCQPVLLALGALLKLIDLLDHKRLDLLLHDGRLLLNDLLSLPRLVLDHTRILSSQLSDELLNLTFFLSLEPLVFQQSLNTANEHLRHHLRHLVLDVVFVSRAVVSVKFLRLQLAAVEDIPSVVNQHLVLCFSLLLGDGVNTLPQVFSSQHDVLNVLEREGQKCY